MAGLLGCLCPICEVRPHEASENVWDDLRLSTRARNALTAAGFKTILQVKRAPDRELLKIFNFGRTSLNETRFVVAQFEAAHGEVTTARPRVLDRAPDEVELVQARYTLAWFPHTTPNLVNVVAKEWLGVGCANAAKRGISRDEWLWRRSRYHAQAGYV
jgi:hypothetical protein